MSSAHSAGLFPETSEFLMNFRSSLTTRLEIVSTYSFALVVRSSRLFSSA